MKITFLGAAHQVTGSRTLVEWKDGRFFLVDCGMEQGENEFEMAEMPVAASAIEYVFLTHAHDDHAGFLNEVLSVTDAPIILHPQSRRGPEARAELL